MVQDLCVGYCQNSKEFLFSFDIFIQLIIETLNVNKNKHLFKTVLALRMPSSSLAVTVHVSLRELDVNRDAIFALSTCARMAVHVSPMAVNPSVCVHAALPENSVTWQ